MIYNCIVQGYSKDFLTKEVIFPATVTTSVFTGWYALKTLGNGSSFFKVSAAAGFHYNHTGGTFD